MLSVTYVFLYLITTSRLDLYTMDSHVLESVWTVVPMIILLFMAFPSLYLLYLIEEVSTPSISIKVIGHQWYWEYQYSDSWFSYSFDSYLLRSEAPEGVFHSLDVDNRLILPFKATVLFLVTSADVLHSWTVPALGIKADACPGRLNYLASTASSSGVFYGQCSEICGRNHRFMPIVLEYVSIESYLLWARLVKER
jgi:cytochrome c oxidase subunit 2